LPQRTFLSKVNHPARSTGHPFPAPSAGPGKDGIGARSAT
jgi:hypothetical protein